jgi:hypothetical protein
LIVYPRSYAPGDFKDRSNRNECSDSFKGFQEFFPCHGAGEFKISRVFDNAGAASKARYHYHCTESGTTVYARYGRKGKPIFAVIDQ